MKESPFKCYFVHAQNERAQLQDEAVKCIVKGKAFMNTEGDQQGVGDTQADHVES